VDTRGCKATALDDLGVPVDEVLGKLCASAVLSMQPQVYNYEGDALANCQAASCLLADSYAAACGEATTQELCDAVVDGLAVTLCDFDATSAVCTAKQTCTYTADDCTYTSGLYVDIPPEMQEEMAKANTSEEYTYNVAVGSLIVWAVLGVIFIVFSGRIHIAIGVIEEASDASHFSILSGLLNAKQNLPLISVIFTQKKS
jgi:hypothetical protein